MIYLICDWFRNENTGQMEYLIDYAVDSNLQPVIMPCVHPASVGAVKLDGEWVLFKSSVLKSLNESCEK